jgi:hypothetical protein
VLAENAITAMAHSREKQRSLSICLNAMTALAHTVETNSYALSRQFALSIYHDRLARTIKRNSNAFFYELICTHTHTLNSMYVCLQCSQFAGGFTNHKSALGFSLGVPSIAPAQSSLTNRDRASPVKANQEGKSIVSFNAYKI